MAKWEYPYKCKKCGAWLYAQHLKDAQLCSEHYEEVRRVLRGKEADDRQAHDD